MTSNEKINIIVNTHLIELSEQKELFNDLNELKRIIKEELIADLDRQIETFKTFQKLNR